MRRLKFINAKLITPERIVPKGCLLIENGRIQAVSEQGIEVEDCDTIDVGGRYLSPGFIDIHTHGGGGHDFMDGTPDAFLGAAREHAKHGTTALLPTTLTSSFEALEKTIDAFESARKGSANGARLLGLHLEGPYLSVSQKGAQEERYIKNPEPEEFRRILSLSDKILRWSAAPELPGALEFGRELSTRGILPSIAHSDATSEEAEQAYTYGYTHVTHFYSAMSSVRRIDGRRVAGVVEAAYLTDDMTVEIIADGVHLPPSLLRLVYKLKGTDRVALVTDSMRAAGLPEGESILGSLSDGMKVIVEDGVAKLPDRSAFAGSVATADRLVRTMVKEAGMPLADAVKMMTLTPARIIGREKDFGALREGNHADLVLFDEEIRVKMTVVGGEIIYCNGGL